LERRGFRGRYAAMGWESMGGDVYGNLERSLSAFNGMQDRNQRHPRWSIMTGTAS
jgi:hypothetical protein